MPKRVRVSHGDNDWTAEIAGQRIALTDVASGKNAGAAGKAAAHVFDVALNEDGRVAATPEGAAAITGVADLAGDAVWVSIGGYVFECRVGHASSASRAGARDTGALMPPMPATVTRIAVKVGDAVKRGDVLIALEAMKMELPVRAPRDFVISAIHCTEGQIVQPGKVLLE